MIPAAAVRPVMLAGFAPAAQAVFLAEAFLPCPYLVAAAEIAAPEAVEAQMAEVPVVIVRPVAVRLLAIAHRHGFAGVPLNPYLMVGAGWMEPAALEVEAALEALEVVEERLALVCFLPAAELAAVLPPYPCPFLAAAEVSGARLDEVSQVQVGTLAPAYHYFAEPLHLPQDCPTVHRRASPDALLNPLLALLFQALRLWLDWFLSKSA